MNLALWNNVTIIVPFRLGSDRFPNKALSLFRGKTLVEHAIDNAALFSPRRIVLTAPREDLEVLGREIEIDPEMVISRPTPHTCASATERVVLLYREFDGDLFLSLPIDEPAIMPSQICDAITDIDAFDGAGVITFYCDFFAKEDYLSSLSAKIVTDRRGMMLYMSRGIIPARKDGSVDQGALKKNVGASLFRRAFLEKLESETDTPTTLDRHEGLEQLRWLELGLPIKCFKVRHIGFGIDVPEQILMLEERLRC
jgi:CMP-2-keto-3-deoxyoctulosonic acid synthetase